MGDEEGLDNLGNLFAAALNLGEELSYRQLYQLVRDNLLQANAFLTSVQNAIIRSAIGEHGAINCGPRGTNFTRIRDRLHGLQVGARRRYIAIHPLINHVLDPLSQLRAYGSYRDNESGGECTNSKQALNRCVSQILARTFVCLGMAFVANLGEDDEVEQREEEEGEGDAQEGEAEQ